MSIFGSVLSTAMTAAHAATAILPHATQAATDVVTEAAAAHPSDPLAKLVTTAAATPHPSMDGTVLYHLVKHLLTMVAGFSAGKVPLVGKPLAALLITKGMAGFTTEMTHLLSAAPAAPTTP
jgi:hypothetical protein